VEEFWYRGNLFNRIASNLTWYT